MVSIHSAKNPAAMTGPAWCLLLIAASSLSCDADKDAELSLPCERDTKWFCCEDTQTADRADIQIISRAFVCDGFQDCGNGRDEVACGGASAAARRARASADGYSWYCDGDQSVVHIDFRCDGVPDCRDGTDELYCESPALPVCALPRDCFPCKGSNGQITLIDEPWRTCDGFEDCPDGADEDPLLCEDVLPGNGASICRACFQCEDGNPIAQFGLTCNGVPDCLDGSDEPAFCSDIAASGRWDYLNRDICMPCFPCEDGSQPAHTGYRCDFFPDCEDGSDEEGCEVAADAVFFECENRAASILSSEVCDHSVDCADGSDEKNCPGLTATCSSGESIPMHWVCDGVADCPDNEDEIECKQCSSEACYLCAALPKDHPSRESSCGRCPESERCFLCAQSELFKKASRRAAGETPWRCDRVPHCADWSDEIGCPWDKEHRPAFDCQTQARFIPMNRTCDLVPDCPNHLDESAETCPDFECDNQELVAFFLRCDGYTDCADKSDENDVHCFTCAQEGDEETAPATKIVIEAKCDGWADCADESDERGCPPLV